MSTSLETNDTFPLVNACLNGTAAFFLLAGFMFIKRKQIGAHKLSMALATFFSAAFLASYLWYHTHYAAQSFKGEGLIRYFYFPMLISHVILAIFILPFILRLLWLAYKQSFERHARMARWVWPLWMYTSVTGVLIYMMLYRWFPALPINQGGG